QEQDESATCHQGEDERLMRRALLSLIRRLQNTVVGRIQVVGGWHDLLFENLVALAVLAEYGRLLAEDVGSAGGLGDHQVTAQAVLDLLDWNLLRVAVGDVLAGGNDLLADLDAVLVEVLDIVSHLAWLAEQLIDQVSVESLDVDLNLVSRHHR